MKRQLTSAAFGVLLAVGTLLPASATAAQAAPTEAPSDAPAEAQGMVLHGCVITAGEDEVIFRVSGTGIGAGGRVIHVKTAAIPDYDPATTADACGAIVVYQQDGVWYAESISVTRDEDGEVTVDETAARVRSGRAGAEARSQESGGGAAAGRRFVVTRRLRWSSSSVSTKTTSNGLSLTTSCSTPAERK